jgi:hypothetical protein
MSGIFQGDIIIKTAIELTIQEMKENPYLVDHMFSDLTSINYIMAKYGQKQIDSCKEWLSKVNIEVYMYKRKDKDRYPCITVEMGSSNEKSEMKHLADDSSDTITLLPKQIGKPIPYIVKPFTPAGYNQVTGLISIPASVDISGVVPGQIIVNPDNGQGFQIMSVQANQIGIQPGTYFKATRLGVVPQHQYYVARIGHIFTQDIYNIGCHGNGDAQTCLWLWSIALYGILRYKESLFEALGFTESFVQNNNPDLNEFFTTAGGEEVWSRYITISGQVEQTWIKSPKRIIESVVLQDTNSAATTPGNLEGYVGGLKILSNLDTPMQHRNDTNWWTDADPADLSLDDPEDVNES